MVATLRELYAKSRTPSQEDKEAAAQTIAHILDQAKAIGHAHASQEEQRGMAWGGNFVNVLSSAWDIVTSFVQRVGDWIADQISGGAEPSQEDIQAEIDAVAGHVGDFEVQAAIENEVWQTLYMAGVSMVVSVPQPGACELCLSKASRGPIPINDFDPPPYHGSCRCSSAPADQEG